MAIGTSDISASKINAEFVRPAGSVMSIKDANTGVYGVINQNSKSRPNGVEPHTFGEFAGYSHSAAPSDQYPHTFTFYSASTSGCGGSIISSEILGYTDNPTLAVGVVVSATAATFSTFTAGNYYYLLDGNRYYVAIQGNPTSSITTYTNCGSNQI